MKSLTLLLLFVTVFPASHAVLQECDPPIPSCQCDVQVLKCNGCSNFPADVPAGTIDFIFENCEFATEVKDLPYTEAKSLQILRSPNLQVFSGAFRNLVNLHTLAIQKSNLMEIRADMFEGLAELTVLSLESASVKMVPDAVFESMPLLATLTLSGNDALAIAPGSFSGLPELLNLNLDHCGLTEIPVDAIKGLEKLKALNFAFNQLVSVPAGAFSELKALEVLKLEQNELTEIEEEAFEGLVVLEEADLSFNKLKALDEDLFEATDALRELYIHENQLATIPDELVEWKELTQLTMSGNPWACNCSNYFMHELQFSPKENITCASPPELIGHSVHNATFALECPGDTRRSTIVLAVIVPLMILCACLIVYFVYKVVATRKRRDGQRNVRYSSVYKDTVETVSGGGGSGKKGKPMPEL